MRLLVAALAVALLPLPASAAPKPYLTDPTGDTQVTGTPSDDIVSLTFTSKVSKGTRYWVTTLRLAGRPAPSSTHGYSITGVTWDGCGQFNLVADSTAEGVAYWWPCGGRDPYTQPAFMTLTGDSITWSLRLSGAPFTPGTKVGTINVSVSLRDPLYDSQLPMNYDDAHSDAPYRFGQ